MTGKLKLGPTASSRVGFEDLTGLIIDDEMSDRLTKQMNQNKIDISEKLKL